MQRSAWAIASLVMGILCFFTVFGLEKAAAAIAFGILGLREIRKNKKIKGKWISIAGIVLGAIAIVLVVYFLTVFLPQLLALYQL